MMGPIEFSPTMGMALVAFGGWSLAAYFVRQIYAGNWVPRATVKSTIDDVNHDRDEWRASHRISEAARQEERDHNAELIRDLADPLKSFLQNFRDAADRRRSDSA